MTEGNEAHVHHLLVYTCNSLNDTHVGTGGECYEGVANEVNECTSDTLIAAWAVGGEVSLFNYNITPHSTSKCIFHTFHQEFVFPDDVAYPIGGEDSPQYLVMELHYDNPLEISGTESKAFNHTL